MGLFKDLGDTKRQAKALGKDAPSAGARFAEMNQKMGALTESLEQSTAAFAPPSPGSVPALAQLLSAEPPSGYLNGDPIVTVSILVHRHGSPPIPATQSIVVPVLQVHRLQPGARIAARIGPGHISAFALDWNARP